MYYNILVYIFVFLDEFIYGATPALRYYPIGYHNLGLNSYISHPGIDRSLYDDLVLDVSRGGYVIRGGDHALHNYPDFVAMANSGDYFFGRIADHTVASKILDVTCTEHPNKCFKGLFNVPF